MLDVCGTSRSICSVAFLLWSCMNSKMASNFPVNELNVSFSDEDVSSLFITQSTFRDVDTQEVNEAADFFDNFEMMYLLVIVGMLRKVIWITWSLFLRTGETISQCSTSIFPMMLIMAMRYQHILTRHSDGKKFVVGPGDKHDGISPSSGSVENESSTKPLYDEKTVGSDLARFGEAVGDVELDVNCCKR